MPWCPNCKTEYREGITHCADCKAELVSEYKEVLIQNATVILAKFNAEHKHFAQRLYDFLEYSGIPSVVLDEGEQIGVYVAPEDFKRARKCLKAFYTVETENVLQRAEEAAFLKGEEYENYFGDDEAEEETAEENGSYAFRESAASEHREKQTQEHEGRKEQKYVSAVSRYEDYRSSGFTFTILGLLGIGVALLNFFGIFSLFGSAFSSFVLFLMFSVFLALGIFSFVKAKALKPDAVKETALVADVKAWMQENITKESVSSPEDGEACEDESKTAELLYLNRLDQLLERVLDVFPELHASLAEQLIEEFCSNHFE